MNLQARTFLLTFLVLLPSIALAATYKKGWVYDAETDQYLTGDEIRALLVGNTLSYDNEDKTYEYFHENGTVYSFHQDGGNYGDAAWCIIDDKFCYDTSYSKLNCPKIKLSPNGNHSYSEIKDGRKFKHENFFTITEGDTQGIKASYDEEGWDVYEGKICKVEHNGNR